MATGRSIAGELIDSLVSEPFMKVVCLLDWNKGLSVEMFRKTRQALAGSYWIDIQCYASTQGVINAQGIYEMFGEYSLMNGGEVRHGLIDWINEWRDEIQDYVKIVLGHKNMSFTEWLNYTAKDKNPADEVAIFCLAHMYSRHVVIYTLSYCWSMLLRHFTYNEQEIHKHCDIKLILLRKYRYAHVRPISPPFGTIPKPFPSKVKEEDSKPKVKTEKKPKQRQQKNSNVMSKVTCRGQRLANRLCSSNISSSNIIANQNCAHNTRPTNNKRTSSKSLCESRQVINYAMLNDGLDPECSPPKKKCRQKIRLNATGPSVTRAGAHAHSMNKKLATVTPVTPVVPERDGELADLEKIMESFDTDAKVIGTIVELDEGGLQGVSDSPPKNHTEQ